MTQQVLYTHKNLFSHLILIIVGILSLSSNTLLAETDRDIEETLVTANRIKKPQSELIVASIVITREEIENSGASDLADLLRFQAGLDIGRNGGPGQTTSIFIRGTESNHTLVLVDGIEINPGTIGGAAIQNINPEIIERIEIIKGPRSSLYGSEAIGGLINIITRKASGTHAEAVLAYGSYASKILSANGSYQKDDRHINLALNLKHTDGFPTFSNATQDRGHDNLGFTLKAGMDLLGNSLEFQHWQSGGTTEYFDFFGTPISQSFKNQSTSLLIDRQINKRWMSSLTIANSIDDINQDQSPDYVATDRLTTEWLNNFTLNNSTQLIGGVYFAREKTDTISFGSQYSDPTEIKAAFTAIDGSYNKLNALLSIRLTDHDTAGDQFSWNAEAAYLLTPGLRMGVSAGRAFRAPDATDRFGFGGNPALKTEESISIAAHLKMVTQVGDFRLEAFQTNIDNLIDFFVFDFISFEGENRNIAEAEIQGLELSHVWQSSDWSIENTALVQSPKDVQSAQYLPRRAQRSFTNHVQRNLGEHSLGLQLLASSERKDSGFSSIINAGYVLANLTGKYQLNERIALNASIENLLNTQYETAAGFQQADRNYLLSVRFQY